jgi:hypothetical protein
MLSKKSIIEFQKLYQKERGRMISFEEAEKQANNLIQLYKSVLSRPVHAASKITQDAT